VQRYPPREGRPQSVAFGRGTVGPAFPCAPRPRSDAGCRATTKTAAAPRRDGLRQPEQQAGWWCLFRLRWDREVAGPRAPGRRSRCRVGTGPRRPKAFVAPRTDWRVSNPFACDPPPQVSEFIMKKNCEGPFTRKEGLFVGPFSAASHSVRPSAAQPFVSRQHAPDSQGTAGKRPSGGSRNGARRGPGPQYLGGLDAVGLDPVQRQVSKGLGGRDEGEPLGSMEPRPA